MEVLKVTLFLFFFVGAAHCSWTLDEFADLIHKIYQKYRTCANELNHQVFQAIAGDKNVVTYDTGLELFMGTSYAQDLGDAEAEKVWKSDWMKAARANKRNYKKRGLDERKLSRFMSRFGGSSLKHIIATAVHGTIDTQEPYNEIDEDEILQFTINLATMAKKAIRVDHYVGCVTHLIPHHMYPTLHKAWTEAFINKRYDKNGDAMLDQKEARKAFRRMSSVKGRRGLDKLFNEFDTGKDKKIDEGEFTETLEGYLSDPLLSEPGIVLKAFFNLYDKNPRNRRVDPSEALAFWADVQSEIEE